MSTTDSMSTTEYQVTGMTCSHCEMSVREEVGQIAGVDQIEVSAQTGRLVVTASAPLDDARSSRLSTRPDTPPSAPDPPYPHPQSPDRKAAP